MSDTIKPGMLTYDDGEEPEALSFPIERHSLIKGDPFKGRNAVIYVDGHKVGEGTIKSVSYETDDEPDEVPPPREPGEWQPPTVTAHATIKASKAEVRRFRRQDLKKTRLPRKLKKAMCHMTVFNEPPEENFTEIKGGMDYSITLSYSIGTKYGYPQTKWVRKAYYKACKELDRFRQWQLETMLEQAKDQQGPEMIITKEERVKLAAMISQHTEHSSIH